MCARTHLQYAIHPEIDDITHFSTYAVSFGIYSQIRNEDIETNMPDQDSNNQRSSAESTEASNNTEMKEGKESLNVDNTTNSGSSELKLASKSNQNDSVASKEADVTEDNEKSSSIDESDVSGKEDQSNDEGEEEEGNANSTDVGEGTGIYKPEAKSDNKMKMRNNNAEDTKGEAAMEVDEAEASSQANNDSDNSGRKSRATEETRMLRRTSKRQRTSASEDNAVMTKKVKATKDENKEEGTARREWTNPTYRWIDPDVKGDHQGLEIDFGGSDNGATNNNNSSSSAKGKTGDWTPPPPFIVRPGDIILISSGDVPWAAKSKADNVESLPQQKEGEAVPLYNDPASREPGIGALDPFVGYVERLYEDDPSQKVAGPKKKKSKSANSTPSQMKVQTRWFFKKEEIKGLSGRFIIQGQTTRGDAKDQIFDAMTSNDLILTDQSDDNDVTSILRKATVVRRKPLDGSDDDDREMTIPEGAFVCRYQLNFCPASSSGGEGTVVVHPFEEESDIFTVANYEIDGMKKISSLNNIVSTDEGSSKEEKAASSNNYAHVAYPHSPRRVITEGPTVGKIHVGPNHQAVVPEQLDLERKTSRRGMANPPSARIPTLVWDPKSNDDSVVESFLDEACALLVKNRITAAEMKPFHEANCVESPDLNAETKRPRECKIDVLLIELHNCKYNAKKALKKVSEKPEKFTTIWTRNEKDQFDASYRAYRESLRAISQSMGEGRSTNDVIDYLYRFKLVENFRRFSAKKREKAREMMETVENRMLNEKAKEDAKNEYVDESDESSSEEEKGKRVATPNGVLSSVSTAGPVNNRIRTWFRTGGGDEDAVGATQLRRNEAANLLSMIKDKVGEDAYLVLAKSLKAYYAHSGSSLDDVKNTAADIMKSHPDLLNTFEAFFPKEIRSS